MAQMMTTKDKLGNVRSLLERQLPEIRRAVPKGIDPQRFARVALTTFQQVPALLDCTPASLMGAMMQAAAWGLELDPVLGQAYLVPYRDKCQLIIGYQGLIELSRRSGEVRNVLARAVYEKDNFTYSFGLDEKLEHTPSEDAEPGRLIAVYAIAYLKDGRIVNGRGVPWKLFDVMTIPEVEKIRERSAAKNAGPWKTDYDAMAKKTVIRRLCKYLPKSVELARALHLDEAADRAEQDLGTFDILPEKAPVVPAGSGSSEPSTLDKLAATMDEPRPQDPVTPPVVTPPAEPASGPRPVPQAARSATAPVKDARDEARAAQASRHEVPRAHQQQREPGEEG